MRPMIRNIALFTVVFAGCGSSETSLEDAFCDLLSSNGGEYVTASVDATGAPEVAVPDQRIEIDLVDEGDGLFFGVVAYTADEAGSFAFGLDEDVPVAIVDGNGNEVPWQSEVTGAACADLAVRYTAELTLDTYYLEIGPTDVATVALAAEESDDDL